MVCDEALDLKQAIEKLKLWYLQATEFVKLDGKSDIDDRYRGWTMTLIDFLYDATNIDPTPLWDVYCQIENHVVRRSRCPLSREPLGADDTARLSRDVRRVEMILECLIRKWNASAPPGPTVRPPETSSHIEPVTAVEKLILEILKSTTQRRTETQITNSLTVGDHRPDEADIRGALTSLERHGMVSYRHDTDPPGYGLANR